MQDIVTLSNFSFSIEDRGRRFRTRLRLSNRRFVAVIVARCVRGYKGADRWQVKCVSSEIRLVSLLARLNQTNDAFLDLFLTPPFHTAKSIRFSRDDHRLKSAVRVGNLQGFAHAIETIFARREIKKCALAPLKE